jgi:hypothetical protein
VLRSRLADRVRLDWTSPNGGEPAEVTGDEVTEAWRTFLSAFEATHHHLENFLIDEVDADHARVRFYDTATHVLAAPGQDGRWVLDARLYAVLRNSSALASRPPLNGSDQQVHPQLPPSAEMQYGLQGVPAGYVAANGKSRRAPFRRMIF